MDRVIKIPNGAILNVYMPKKKGSLKRGIMNVEANILKRFTGSSELLNHTAKIVKDGSNVMIWEASILGGVTGKHIDNYDKDAVFIITSTKFSTDGIDILKKEAGKKYDLKSWGIYLRFLVTGKWKGFTKLSNYSKKWFCSELISYSDKVSDTPYDDTPTHVYELTKENEHWRGTYIDLWFGLKKGTIQISK